MYIFFSVRSNKVFVAAANKPNAKRNKIVYFLYASDSPSLNSRIKNKNKFEMLGFIASIKNIKQNI